MSHCPPLGRLGRLATSLRRVAFFAALGLLAAPLARADRVVTVDGRVLKPLKAREHGEGYKLVFEAGEVVLPDKTLVKAVEIEGDMSDYVPKNEDEREKLAQGYVRYDGRWWSKPAYEDQLRKEYEASRARTEAMAAHSDFANAWEKETKHFHVFTNTSPELLEYYASLLEEYFELMDKRFGIKLSPAMRRMRMVVRIYKSREEFHKLNEAGVGGGVAGYFSPGSKDLNFYHDYEEPAISDWVCLHEGTHLLTHLIDPQYIAQIWINEAVADYFGSADIEIDKRGRIEITPGKLQTDRVLTVQQALKNGNAIALEDLFLIDRASFHAFEYAHAWSFVYFLNNTPKYKKGFDTFFKDLYTLKKGIEFEIVNYADISGTGKIVAPKEIRRVLLESLRLEESDVPKLDTEWKDFVAAIPLEGPEARFKRGYQAVVYGRMFEGDREANMKEALEDLDAAIEAGVGGGRAYYARAQLLMLRGDLEPALKDLEKAIELDPLNARYRNAMGDLVARGRSAEDAPEAAAYYGLAVELAPDNDSYRRDYEEYKGQ